jgi:hypothetical protein
MKIAKSLLENGPLQRAEYNQLCGSYDKGDNFLSKNVFAINSKGLYDFENKIVEQAVRDNLSKWQKVV